MSDEQMRSDEQVRNAECEVQNDEQMRNAEREMRNDEQMRNAECEMQNDEQMRNAECEMQNDEQTRNAECEMQNDEQERNAEREVRNDEQMRSDEQNLASLEAELEKEREARALCESKLLCIRLLDEYGLPRELGDYLATNDAVETEKRVKCVAKIIKDSVNEGVLSRLETLKTPSRSKSELTKKQFNEMSLADMQRLYVTDKELYRRLSGKRLG